jgi:hypothetical protein
MDVKAIPAVKQSLSGMAENEETAVQASFTNFQGGYFVSPAARAGR